MSAPEMLCFSRYLGLITGDFVPLNNPLWQTYCSLRKLIDLITAPQLQFGSHHLIKLAVTEYLDLYVNCLQLENKPKHHLMTHYATIFEKSGPTVLLWSMRYESKHRESKMYSNVSCSRKNIIHSISFKNQLKLCHLITSESFF